MDFANLKREEPKKKKSTILLAWDLSVVYANFLGKSKDLFCVPPNLFKETI